jgi:hypothetical protein
MRMTDLSQEQTCPYCQESKLLADSHIIPMGIWRLKDSGTGFLESSSDSHLPPKKIPKGWYEKLLCKDCDGDLGRDFDQYGRDFFASESEWTVHTLGPVGAQHSFSEVSNYDHAKLKLFILSVLWRASLAKDPAFSSIKLLTQQESRLRNMLKDKDPGDVPEFGCAIFKYFDDGRNLHKVAFAPRLFRASGCVRYAEIQFNEFACRINVSNQKDKWRYDQVGLNPNEPLRIIHTSPERKISVGAKTLQDQHARYQTFRESR